FLWARERFAPRHFILSLLLILYTFSIYISTFGPYSSALNRSLIASTFIFGALSFVTYVGILSQHLPSKPRWLPYVTLPLRLLVVAITIDLIVFFSLGISLHLTREPTIFLVLIPAMLSLIATGLLIFINYRKTLSHQRML